MAQNTSQRSNYTQGYSKSTIATHQTRTAESDAAFLLPHIKKTDRILDVGCGPGTITLGLAKYASEGSTVGVDISADVLQRAKAAASETGAPTHGPGSVKFEEGNVLERLPYADDTFDIVYSSQVFGHMPPPDKPLQALAEMRRVLKLGGILASRDGVDQHFYPQSLDIDRLWVRNQTKVLRKGVPDDAEAPGKSMPALFRKAGFDANNGKVRVGAGTTVYSEPAARKWLAGRAAGQLKPEDPFRQSWLEAGITEDEIEQTIAAAEKWADTEDAWFVAIQCEMLAWK